MLNDLLAGMFIVTIVILLLYAFRWLTHYWSNSDFFALLALVVFVVILAFAARFIMQYVFGPIPILPYALGAIGGIIAGILGVAMIAFIADQT